MGPHTVKKPTFYRRWAFVLLVGGLLAITGCPRDDGIVETVPTTDQVTMADVLAAEDGRVVSPELLAAVTATDPDVREAACRALGRIGSTAQTADLTGRFSRERDPRVKAAILESLGQLDPARSAALIRKSLTDKEPRVRIAAARSVDFTVDRSVREALLKRIDDDDETVAVLSMYAMIRSAKGDAFVPTLLYRLDELSGPRRLAAIYVASRFSAATSRLGFDLRRTAREKMLELTHSDLALERMFAAHGLSRPTNEDEAARVGELTTDPAPSVRIEAVRALSFVGAPVYPFLEKTILDSDERVSMATVRRLGKMKGADVMEILANFVLGSESTAVKVMGLKSLAESDVLTTRAMGNGLSQSDNEHVRHEIARLMPGDMTQEGIVSTMKRLRDDKSAWVREAALPSSANLPGSLAEQMADFIGDRSTSARLGILGAVGYRLDDQDSDRKAEAWPVLRTVWDGAREDGDLTTLAAAVDLLDKRDEKNVESFLREAMELRFRPLQQQAFEALRRLGVEVTLADPTPPMSPATYVEVAEWAERPRAAIIRVGREGFEPARFTVRLDTQNAPLVAWHFAKLAEDGFYDGIAFHDIDPGRSLMTGAPLSNGIGGPNRFARDAVSSHPFGPGTVAMIGDRPDRIGSRWVVSTGLQPELTGKATVIGRVIQNLAGVVGRILPGDQILSIQVYEGDGSEPLR
ncbi:MAG: HEAT repeat domain-containing protein [Acidobacteriota bacterium]|nr:HEAT repeat domain-containing protein [Acidobacteriota bacterium]MDH3786733.1 HEAT repeat domain-containing protein [Acidobacteriota bacterium]